MYKPGKKGYKKRFQCECCGTVYPAEYYLHSVSLGDDEVGKYCCRCLGHESLSCLPTEKLEEIIRDLLSDFKPKEDKK